MDRGTLRFSKNGIEIDKFFTNITGEVFPVASFDHVDDQVTVTKRVRKVPRSRCFSGCPYKFSMPGCYRPTAATNFLLFPSTGRAM